MKLKTIKDEEISLMSLDDLAYVVLKEKNKKMKISDLFKTICDLQGLGEKYFEEQIADFFALLSTEKRFIQLDKGFWDLKENHTNKVSIENMDDEIIEEEELNIADEHISEETEEYIDDNKDVDDDESDDELQDLVVIDENAPEEDLDL